MKALQTTIFCISFATLSAGYCLAGPPLLTDDAGTVDVGKAEFELNGSYTDDKTSTSGVTTKCSAADAELKITTGLYKDTGISLAIPYTINGRVKENDQTVSRSSGFGDMTVEMKYAFAELAGIKLSVKPIVIIPTGNYSEGLSEGRWQFGTTLIATREFADGTYALHANLGYEHHNYRDQDVKESTRSDLWAVSVAGEAEVTKGLFIVADIGLATTADKSTSELSTCFLTGARYEISDLLDINAGVKLGLSEPEDDISILYGLVFKY